MDHLRNMFTKKSAEQDYSSLPEERLALHLEDEHGYASSASYDEGETEEEVPFSWFVYCIFALLGIAMLWAWNMFLAAAPYFQTRFATDPWILSNFQSTLLSVSTCTNLASMLVLTNIQYTASYPFRINSALFMNVAIFSLLTASTSIFLRASPLVYLVFLLLMVAGSAWACGLIQNGAFAYAASFGRPEYTQAIMAGQGVAGVLPPIAQMVTVLTFPAPSPPSSSPSPTPSPPALGMAQAPVHIENYDAVAAAGSAAFFYFLTAVLISVCALVAFQPLVRRHDRLVEHRMAQDLSESLASLEEAERAARKVVGMKTLFFKLHWHALAVFVCFLVSMFFPVLTPKVASVTTRDPPAPILQPTAFIPLAFFFWNLGDLAGRMSTMLPVPAMVQDRPVLLFAFGVARFAFLPLYFLCNLGGRGAILNSDLFYLCLVQLPFGLSSGWLSSTAMMTAGDWVEEGEREAAGSFMGLALVAGLATGSFLSFALSNI